ncbi:MAG: zinc-ribbon domain-containing protein [Candidatus Bathyarchaeota archaeon]|nr:zinc-ribbon domain-containing protein [Candidatus Bathyarchaeota archaeon]
MVYCTKCGTENDEDAQECKNCGAALKPSNYSYRRSDWDMDRDWFRGRRYNWSVLFGLFLIIMGASSLLEDIFWWMSFDFLWPVFIMAIGVLIVTNSMKR